MKKTAFLLIFSLLVIVGLLGGVKALQIKRMTDQSQQFVLPPATVTTAQVRSDTWPSVLTAVGSLDAVQGVTVSAELPGKVVKIAFTPGRAVKQGDLLVQQDTTSERAQLRSAQATMELARLNLQRAEELLPEKVITRSSYDATDAEYKQAEAQIEALMATIDKKNVRAPFAGRLGIRLINLGQILNDGDPIVSLQSMDPIYVNFHLPQRDLASIHRGLAVNITSDAHPDAQLTGTITAVNPQVDSATRNIRVQATVANADEQLRPGMFVNVAVMLPEPQNVLTLPATSVLYAPYSDSVFVVEETPAQDGKEKGLVLRQQFVRLGKKRGDYIAVLSGLKEGETVVSTGVFKFRNGQAVVVDNKLSPEFKMAPKPEDA